MCFCYNMVKNELDLSCKEIIYIIIFFRNVELLGKKKLNLGYLVVSWRK